MAQLGDVQYRFPKTDEWTNAAFLLLALAPLSFWATWAVVPAAATVCLGSWWWHRFEDVLSRRFDELGMMMTMAAIAGVLGYRVLGDPVVFLGVLAAWIFYYRNLHQTSSFHHIGYWAVPILAATIYLAGWEVLLPVGLTVFALYGQFSLPWQAQRYEHGPRHGLLWHVPVALSLYSVLFVTSPCTSPIIAMLPGL